MYLLSHTSVYWENDFTVNACIQSTVTSATVSVICQCDQLCYFVIQVFFDWPHEAAADQHLLWTNITDFLYELLHGEVSSL